MIHISRTEPQPATNWLDHHIDPPMRMRCSEETLVWVSCCKQKRPAGDSYVYSYFDGPTFFCAAGRGCKAPSVIAEKKAREFRNRSAGQKARWAKAAK